ncbi:MAG: ImmA/IrrE family metallo-endopeptidase [Caldilineaceae bacterium SB0661_bin_32]|uniref:ImmA/IrrE family metallo-endopeptidase n=1 Tax=Caldilineaceae bacterium SB0661_bin_32 TaxID=2605255 RepID=A0A6B1DE43_9CHLR|nr:ImmA/IrrE family metallo-endopeptidase [Caldilineaceae bacterium SB0661_bin_32]
MTSRRQKITLEPEVLIWARERVGLSEKKLADKMQVKPERVTEWERTGETSIAQVDRLASCTYTPLGYLYLSEPPDESLPIRDFRTRGDGPPKRPSPNLLDTVYQMQRRQNWMRDDLIEGGSDPLEFVGAYSLTDGHIEVAAAMRVALGLADGWPEEIDTWSEALGCLRIRSDEAGILVASNGVVGNSTRRKLDRTEFQGFALVDEYAPLIFVNAADFKTAQMFTLAHEVAHLFVGETGLSLFDRLLPVDHGTERFCNRVAAEFLVPQEELQDYWATVQDPTNPYREIAQEFKVSDIVAAYRALDLDLIDRDTFFTFYNENRCQAESRKTTTGRGNIWDTLRWRIGPRFAGAVARATEEGRLLYREAYSLTGLKGDTFEQMPEKLGIVL